MRAKTSILNPSIQIHPNQGFGVCIPRSSDHSSASSSISSKSNSPTVESIGVDILLCTYRLISHTGARASLRPLHLPCKVSFVPGRTAAISEFRRHLFRRAQRYSTTPRNGNPANGNHLEICLSFSQKNGNSLTWVLVALTVCFTYPVLYRFSAESRAGEWEL